MSTVALSVTYGNRVPLVEKVLSGLARNGTPDLLLVANGVSPSVARQLRTLLQSYSRGATMVLLRENTGSAGGFATALSCALSHPQHYSRFLLLDDDNVLEQGALAHLIAAHQHLSRARGDLPLAVSALRPARWRLAAIAAGTPASTVYPAPEAFLSFDLLQWLGRNILPGRHSDSSSLVLPYAPYGGLLVSRQTLEIIGVPRRELVLYEDDSEFTWRITRLGGMIVLVPSAVISELETPWYETAGGHGLRRLLTSPSDTRVYFTIRNRVHFESYYSHGHSLRRKLNTVVLTCVLMILILVTRQVRRARLLIRSYRDAKRAQPFGSYWLDQRELLVDCTDTHAP